MSSSQILLWVAVTTWLSSSTSVRSHFLQRSDKWYTNLVLRGEVGSEIFSLLFRGTIILMFLSTMSWLGSSAEGMILEVIRAHLHLLSTRTVLSSSSWVCARHCIACLQYHSSLRSTRWYRRTEEKTKGIKDEIKEVMLRLSLQYSRNFPYLGGSTQHFSV